MQQNDVIGNRGRSDIKGAVFCWFIGGWSVPWGSCVPVQRAGAAPAEGRPSNSRGGTLTWRGGAESRAGTPRYNFKNICIILSPRSKGHLAARGSGSSIAVEEPRSSASWNIELVGDVGAEVARICRTKGRSEGDGNAQRLRCMSCDGTDIRPEDAQ